MSPNRLVERAAPLPRSFFTRSALEVAPALLGTELVHITDEGPCSGIIVEVEAYCGPDDRAAHSFGGRRTARTEAMYLAGGHAYVYQIYGMHFCFNVVAAREGQPEAVLVRAVEPLLGVEQMARRRGLTLDRRGRRWLAMRSEVLLAVSEGPQGSTQVARIVDLEPPPPALRRLTDGPAKLCAALAIDRRHNGMDLTQGRLFLRQGLSPLPSALIARGPRINVDYAGEWAHKPWRFWLRGHPFVSGHRRENPER